MERYFVSYSYACDGGYGIGNSEIKSPKKITGVDEIKQISKVIEESNGFKEGTVVILNFKRFDTE